MFTPLTFNKNQNIKVDRFNNTNYTDLSTNSKYLGLGIPADDYWTPGPGIAEGTIVCQAYPNSDNVKATGNGEYKWTFWTTELVDNSAWFQFWVSTQDNTQIGSYTNYPANLGSSGLLKGSFAVGFRVRPTAGTNSDGMFFIDSGSYYDWTDPQPVRIALSYDRAADTLKASINGETKNVNYEYRFTTPDPGTNIWLTDLYPSNANGSYTTFGYNEKINVRFADSGSYSEIAYYSSSLTQDEMNLITNQPYGQPTDVLDKRPQLLYRIREEQKETATGTSMPTSQLGGNTAYPNLGTLTDANLQQLKTVKDSTGIITSGSILNTQNGEYYG